MSIHKRWLYNERMVRDAPEWRGVYVLWQDRVPLAVGHATGGVDTIQARLLTHLANAPTAGTDAVTHYSWEICPDPVKRRAAVEAELGLALEADRSPEAS